MTEDPIPVVTPDQLSDGARPGNAVIWGVVLAAGTSQRFGTANKLLAEYRGKPVVEHATETILHSDIDGTSVVTGYERERVEKALSNQKIEYVYNPLYTAGQSTSVRTGVHAARCHDADAVLVMLGDMPNVAIQSVNLLVEAYRARNADIIAPSVDGHRGNPVLFDARLFDELATLNGDTGGKQLFDDNTLIAIETGDNGIRKDIDKQTDLQTDSNFGRSNRH